MILTLGFNSQFVGSFEGMYEVDEVLTEDEVKELFYELYKFKYDENCYYNIE